MTSHKMRPRSMSTGGGHSVPVGPVLLLVGGALAVLAAVLGRYGFTGRDHGLCSAVAVRTRVSVAEAIRVLVVGIDLGTTYSVVAISQRNNVTVIPDSHGHLIIPSMVAFLPDGGLIGWLE